MSTLATLIVRIKGDASSLSAAFTRAKKDAVSFRQAFQSEANFAKWVGQNKTLVAGFVTAAAASSIAAASAVAASVGRMTGEAIAAAAALHDMAQRTSVSVETLSGLSLVAKQSGTDLNALALGLARMNKLMYEAAHGNKQAQQTFKDLHTTYQDGNRQLRSTEQVIKDISKRFREQKDAADKTALAMKVFGKSGATFIPLLNEDLDKAIEKAHKLGLVVSTEMAAAADHFADNIEQLKLSTRTFGNMMAEKLLPMLNEWTDLLTRMQEAGAVQFMTKLTAKFSELLPIIGPLIRDIEILSGILRRLGVLRPPDLTKNVPGADTAGVGQADDSGKKILDMLAGRQRELALLGQNSEAQKAIYDTTKALYGLYIDWPQWAKDEWVWLAKGLDTRKEILENQKVQEALAQKAIDERGREGLEGPALDFEAVGDALQSLQDELDLANALTGAQEDHVRALQMARDLHEENAGWIAIQIESMLNLVRAAQDMRALRDAAGSIEDYVRGTGPSPFTDASLAESAKAFRKFSEGVAGVLENAISTALVNAFAHGEFSFKSFAAMILEGIAQVAAQIAAMLIVMSVFRAIGMPLMLAAGGIVRRPTLAVIGESGPEAVVPLDRLQRMGGGESSVNVRNINLFEGQFIGDWLATPVGEKVVLNVISKNRRVLGMN